VRGVWGTAPGPGALPLRLTPFEVNVSDDVIARLRARLRSATLPAPRGEAWEHGASVDYLEYFRGYWLEEFDWAAAQARLNAHPQFTVKIEGLKIHFYWVRRSGHALCPLVLTHGWPGSVLEFLSVIDAFAEPDKSGNVADSFDVVVPSLPGFGFSGRPAGVLGPQSTARLWRRLMTEVLGYERFGAQGGDLGSMVTAYLGGEHADVVSAIHLNFVPIRPVPDAELSAEERQWKEDADGYRANELDYFGLQEHRPQTLVVALQDKPARGGGLDARAAELVERRRRRAGISDRGPDHEPDALHRDRPNRIVFVVLPQLPVGMPRTHPTGRVEVPTGIAVFPKEMLNGRPPRTWVERDYNLVHGSVMQRGGHFACLEQPDLFVRDVRRFFRAQVDGHSGAETLA
jgi:pimeloyl-ACP methyl ester carboxylesterase